MQAWIFGSKATFALPWSSFDSANMHMTHVFISPEGPGYLSTALRGQILTSANRHPFKPLIQNSLPELVQVTKQVATKMVQTRKVTKVRNGTLEQVRVGPLDRSIDR